MCSYFGCSKLVCCFHPCLEWWDPNPSWTMFWGWIGPKKQFLCWHYHTNHVAVHSRGSLKVPKLCIFVPKAARVRDVDILHNTSAMNVYLYINTLHCIALYCIAFHCIDSIALYCIVFHTLPYLTVPYIIYITSHFITLHDLTVHHITYTTTHYVTLDRIYGYDWRYAYLSIHPSIHPSIYLCMYLSILYLYIYNTVIAIDILDGVFFFLSEVGRTMHISLAAARRSCGQLVQRGGQLGGMSGVINHPDG